MKHLKVFLLLLLVAPSASAQTDSTQVKNDSITWNQELEGVTVKAPSINGNMTTQFGNLVNYKRCYFYESVIGVPLGVFGICATVFYEHTASPLGLFFISLGVLAGASCAYFGWKKHKNTMVEIEHNLAELKNFE